MLSKEELLKPRYKVIADFPQWSSFAYKKGDILELKGIHFVGRGTTRSINEKDIDLYPSVIKKLEWWEDRKIEDMPEYVRHCVNNRVFKVKKWKYDYGELIAYESIIIGGIRASWLTPATREEYEQF